MTHGLSDSVLDAIGDTPLLELKGIYCKLEYLNPSYGTHLTISICVAPLVY